MDRTCQPWAPYDDPHAHQPWAPCDDPHAHQPWAPCDHCLAGPHPHPHPHPHTSHLTPHTSHLTTSHLTSHPHISPSPSPQGSLRGRSRGVYAPQLPARVCERGERRRVGACRRPICMCSLGDAGPLRRREQVHACMHMHDWCMHVRVCARWAMQGLCAEGSRCMHAHIHACRHERMHTYMQTCTRTHTHTI